MDFELNSKLRNYRNKLYKYLFSPDDIEKWEANEPITINRKFVPLLQGDWTRSAKFDGYQGMNLDEILYKSITKTELFNLIKQEISRTINFQNNDYYVHNYNPNLFFLLFDQFYGCRIKKTKILFDAKVLNDQIYGISFCNESRTVLREETLYLIELHSMFILNQNLQKIINSEDFTKIFITNCYIQFWAKKNYNSKNRYIDLSYKINHIPFLIEINEKSHSKILDYFKDIDVELSTGARLNVLELYEETHCIDKTFKEILKNFCVGLYKAGLKDESIILFMVEFADFDVNQAITGVKIVNKTIETKLSEINGLILQDPNEKPINLGLLLIKLIGNGVFSYNRDFINWNQVTKKYKKVEGYEEIIICWEMDNIIINSRGIIKLLSNVPGYMWSRKDEYFDYLDNLQEKYIKTISEMLEDKNYSKIIEKFIENEKIIRLFKFDQDKYFDKIREKVGKRPIHRLFHEKLPFLKVSNEDGKFVDFSIYKNLVNDKYLEKLSDYHVKSVNKNKLEKAELVLGYTVMDPNEILEIYSMTQKQFDKKYYQENNNTTEFID